MDSMSVPGVASPLAGFAEALTVRATVQCALGLIVEREYITAGDAYVRLRLQAADAGVSLLTAATKVITKPVGGPVRVPPGTVPRQPA
jgi:AmiR/NasT family two-component response regulator